MPIDNIEKKNPKFNISGPIGSFVNHVRWLMLIDPLFIFNILRFDKQKYNILKGPSWPSYKKYVINDLTGVPESVKEEFNTLDAYILEFNTPEKKLSSLKYKIYPESRTWHNWLITEWKFRNQLNDHIGVTHNMDHSNDYSKNLLLTIEPDLAHRCYLKFNSNLNSTSVDIWKQRITNENTKINNMARANPQQYKILATDVLYQPSLDRNFYNELIQWFDLTDNYEQASYAHQLWHAAHARAEKEFVNDIRKFYEN